MSVFHIKHFCVHFSLCLQVLILISIDRISYFVAFLTF